ncbi:OmpH family outer membrane protein [Granulibacter bethesdensis]|uniref:Outer membrane protein n=1 Tax=Granulibacter bethesdensis (strain ATCC BAA-1260 / CGDNIH1) TaxID=391165 RepID=Q0BTL3_GRABC|nr:OmpH family outer membrane protein [Granulibacter bethesdensis]ABI61839.1 Hypothetical protein GbCGDNIH1_0941 [Granulibacter bethesdensis CGDNIH1]APH51651.1 Hypothetical protein GbCGDNIH5_0941 [Granulibacter bethesdensis]APH64344.1 Hypothetical protein GbCGDNIH1I4_0941 [Granulibacter bethesdensis]
MQTKRQTLASALLAAAIILPSAPVLAQGYFIPGQQKGAAAGPGPRARPAAPPVQAPPPSDEMAGQPQEQGEPPLPQIPLPPVPELPKLTKGAQPPAAIVGVLGVPEVMRGSTAAQQVERVIGGRRNELAADAQKEQQVWRQMQQQIQADRGKLSVDQLRNRERALQERVQEAQRKFRDRNRTIQLAAQVSLGQIERTLIAVIRQVAESRNMNLVLHRAQVALNVNEFDITKEVIDQLNKILPEVIIPPPGKVPTEEDAKLPKSVLDAAVKVNAADPSEPAKQTDQAAPASAQPSAKPPAKK